jgi:hypothetical protein
MGAEFGFVGFYLRNLKDLVSKGLRSLFVRMGIEGSGAFLALRGIEILDLIHVLYGQQLPVLARVPRLCTGFAPTGGALLSFHFRSIGGRRL